MDKEYTVEGEWSTGGNGSLIYTALAKEKNNPDNILAISTTEIPFGARILAIVDAYDAMKSDRPYRDSLTEEEAIRELKIASGSQFDPEIVKIFLNILKN